MSQPWVSPPATSSTTSRGAGACVGATAVAPEGTLPVSAADVQAVATRADTAIKARMRPVWPAGCVAAVSRRRM
ncbi:hypothetical protein GCM10010171_02970 [Actinokineospora fastidiosa]|uniref:Uncharacterized protein n=1 Tax=Actinokineospora fastidiosa TaxID=1816 RepID=A0A918G1N5_9PSEU|nr:hypothetical protein GCM10010171_02970 [Actinokineospora fastidiosa]